jgi:hypothetical protein
VRFKITRRLSCAERRCRLLHRLDQRRLSLGIDRAAPNGSSRC